MDLSAFSRSKTMLDSSAMFEEILSTEDIKKSALNVDTAFGKDLEEKDDEIGSLTKAFKSLVRTVQDEAKKEAKEGKES